VHDYDIHCIFGVLTLERIPLEFDMQKITAYIEKDQETKMYVAIVPGIPGAHTQAKTLDELQKNLKEVIELCLEEMTPRKRKQLPEFVGIHQIEVTP
jgi:predicted RNase H-like HicB family nuclease